MCCLPNINCALSMDYITDKTAVHATNYPYGSIMVKKLILLNQDSLYSPSLYHFSETFLCFHGGKHKLKEMPCSYHLLLPV